MDEQKSSDDGSELQTPTTVDINDTCYSLTTLEWYESFVIGTVCVVVSTAIIQLNWIIATGLYIVFILSFYSSGRFKEDILTRVFDWKFRPNANCGIAIGTILVPLVVVSNTIALYNQDPVKVNWMECYQYYLAAVGTSLLCVINSFYCDCLYESNPGICAKIYWCGMIASVALIPLLGGVFTSFILGAITGFSVVCKLVNFLPHSFTFGEGVLVSHGLVLFLMDSVLNITGYYSKPKLHSCLQVLLLGALFIGLAMYPTLYTMRQVRMMQEVNQYEPFLWKWSISFYIGTMVFILSVLQSWLWYLLGENPILFALYFIFDNQIRIILVTIWLILVGIAIALVTWHSSPDRQHKASSTTVRKYFHVVATIIYTSGLIIDSRLLYLGSAGTFSIFIILEYIRVFGIKPFGEALHDAFSVFIDDRDVGIPILTHIYLLLGFSLPVWLYPLQHDQGCTLLMYSGVLSLGIGDTAAALFGSMYGHYKWPGSKKTKEGTAAAIVLQILFCCLLSLCGVKIPSWASVIFAVVCTSLLESFTSQIDNIILPLFMYCVLAVLL